MRANASYDIKLSCFVDSPSLAAEMAKLYRPLCPLPCCWENGKQEPFTSFKWLKQHLQQDHQLFYCLVCLQRRPLFLAEQTLYTDEALQLHQKGLWKDDPAGFAGHPYCFFCGSHTLYLDGEDLMKHMLQKHFYCDFCNRDQFLFTFFCTREEMYEHFRASHKICDHPKCAGLDTMLRVYRDEFDLDVHRQREHHARPTNFKPADFTRFPSSSTSGGGSSSGSSYGVGGDARYPPLRASHSPVPQPLQASSALFRSPSPASASAAGATGGVSNAADITVASITFDFMTHQRVLDLTPKNRTDGAEGYPKGGRGRGGWRKKTKDAEATAPNSSLPASFSPFQLEAAHHRTTTTPSETATVREMGGDRPLCLSRTAGVPTHFVHPAHTILRTVLQRKGTAEDVTATAGGGERGADASEVSSPSTTTSSPVDGGESTMVVHGHWGTQPAASHPMIAYVDGDREGRGGNGENTTPSEGSTQRWRGRQGDGRVGEGSGEKTTAPFSVAPYHRTREEEDDNAATCEPKDGQERTGATATWKPHENGKKKKGISTTTTAMNAGDAAAAFSSAPIPPTLDARSAHARLDALLHQQIPQPNDYRRFTQVSRDFMDSTIKTSEYYDALTTFFSFEVLEQVIPLFLASCPMEDKRVALRELWKMKTSPEMVRREKVRREEEEAKRTQKETEEREAAEAAFRNRTINIWGSSKGGEPKGNRKGAWKKFADTIRHGEGGKGGSNALATAATPSTSPLSPRENSNGDRQGRVLRVDKEGTPVSPTPKGMTYAAVAGKKTWKTTPPSVAGHARTSPTPSMAAVTTEERDVPLGTVGGLAARAEGKKEERWMEAEEKERWKNNTHPGRRAGGGDGALPYRGADDTEGKEVEVDRAVTMMASSDAAFKNAPPRDRRRGGGDGSSWATMATAAVPQGQAALAPAAFPVDAPRPVPKPSKHVDGNANDQFPSLLSAEAQREQERRVKAATTAAAKRAGKKPQLNAWFSENKKI